MAPTASARLPILKSNSMRGDEVTARLTLEDAHQPPEDQNAVIRRYIDFTKLVAMLHDRALWFSRADKLGDSFEGSFTSANIEARPAFWGRPFTGRYREKLEEAWREAPCYHFINSWHMNDHESDAMWKIYALRGDGIAIRSTYKRLRDSTVDFFPPVHLIRVQYIDFDADLMPETEPMAPFAFKRKSFEHEQELRAVIQAGDYWSYRKTGEATERPGWMVEVSLDQLIEAIEVAPDADPWVVKLIEKVADHYEIDATVVTSELARTPQF